MIAETLFLFGNFDLITETLNLLKNLLSSQQIMINPVTCPSWGALLSPNSMCSQRSFEELVKRPSSFFSLKLLSRRRDAIVLPTSPCNQMVVADLTLDDRTCLNLLFSSCMLGDLGLARWRPPLLFSPFPPPSARTTWWTGEQKLRSVVSARASTSLFFSYIYR